MMLQRQKGIALLEALLAAVVLAIGLLGTIGLQARAYAALSDASVRAEATIATEKLIGLMSTDQANLGSYAMATGGTPGARLAAWYAELQRAIPGANCSVVIAAPAAGTTLSAVTVTINWQRKANGPVSRQTVTSYVSQST